MHQSPPWKTFRSLWLAALWAVAFVLLGSSAHAAGTLTITDKGPQEIDGRWKIKVTMNMGKAPDIAHVPMIFSFTPVVLYERFLEDKTGDKPQISRKPLVNQPSINESMDVGFSDSSGKTYATTKFDFKLRRDRGFEAGEYEMVVTRSTDGVKIGQKQRIILNGDNPIVDRRAMVFVANGPKKKDPAVDAASADGAAPSADPAAPAAEPAADPEPTEEAPAPPPVEPKQGGCGCSVAGAPQGGALAGLGLAMLGALVIARRRRA